MKNLFQKLLLILIAVISTQGECYANSVVDAGWQAFNFGSIGTTGTLFNETTANNVNLTITDAFVVGDQFAIFDNGVLLGNTSNPNMSASWTSDPTAAIATGFSNISFNLLSGINDVTYQVIASAPGYPSGGGAFFNAITVSAVPVPAAIWMFASGLVGLVAFRKKSQV